MKIKLTVITFIVSLYPLSLSANECVILLHGLARTASSMNKLERELGEHGYKVVNIAYPSRKKPIEELAGMAVEAGVAACKDSSAHPLNFVTHSLGGILVRQYYRHRDSGDINRVVMLGPPNHGSEVVDNLRNAPGFKLLNGPAGLQLGTDESSVPKSLGPVNFELGVIAGTRSINLILSTFLPNPDDGKVSVESAKVEGMCGFVTLPVTHSFMMRNSRVIAEVVAFLKNGRFASESAVSSGCRGNLTP